MTDNSNARLYDVVICGAGLAGLTLARQLRMNLPSLSILLIDRLARPLPEATFKVGESTQEVGAYYLANILGLTGYFEECHLRKMGLRYFFGDPHGPFKDRPEFGLSTYHPVRSYQIDRGRLENDLRQFNAEAGIELAENCSVQDIEISGTSDPHRIIFSERATNEVRLVRSRWVVDATGRRRLLQKRLNLGKEVEGRFSAAWFRIKGRVDVSDFVPPEEEQWHSRVTGNNRYFSTNHLMGDGYWVWLIALSSGQTSVGIVAADQLHSFSSYNTYERACSWLEKHEPVVAARLRDETPSDFLVMHRYSHSSSQVFSHDRWACVGEAGVFSDPHYSPGADQIGFANCITARLIELEMQGRLSPDFVDQMNLFFLSYNEGVTRNIQGGYPFFGESLVMAAKLIWDFVSSWAFSGPLMFNAFFLDTERFERIRRITGRYVTLSHRMQKLFAAWAQQSPGRGSFEFIDYLGIPFIRELRLRNLNSDKTEHELEEDHRASMETLEELAQVLFLISLYDTLPEEVNRFSHPVWLNAWGIGFDKRLWEAHRLFKPTSKPRDLTPIMDQIKTYIHIGEPTRRFSHSGD